VLFLSRQTVLSAAVMPVEIQPGLDGDATRFAEIEHLAYKDNPMTPLLFPGPFPEGVLARRAEALLKGKIEDPQVRWVKAIDTDTNELLGWAQWQIINGPRLVAPEKSTFGQGCNVEACEEFFGAIQTKRHELMEGKHHARMFIHRPVRWSCVTSLNTHDFSAQSTPDRPKSKKTRCWRHVG